MSSSQSYIRDMITFNLLFDSTNWRLCKNILFYFMIFLKNDSKISFSCVSDLFYIALRSLIILRFFVITIQFLELNWPKTTPQKLKVKLYSYK